MRELAIKFLEYILKILTEKEISRISDALHKEALELVDRAAEQAVFDLDHVFKSSNVLQDVEKVSSELDKIHEIPVKLLPKEVIDAIQLAQEICQTVSGLHKLIEDEIRIESFKLKEAINNAKSDDSIREIMELTNSVLSGRISAIAEAFIGGVIKVDE